MTVKYVTASIVRRTGRQGRSKWLGGGSGRVGDRQVSEKTWLSGRNVDRLAGR